MSRYDSWNGRLAFLVAAPYSGATILSMALHQHPSISSDGEIFHPERGRSRECSCRRSLERCPYFRNIFRDLYRKGEGYDARYFYYVPRYSKIYPYSRALEGFWISDAGNDLRRQALRLPWHRSTNQRFFDTHTAAIDRSLHLRKAEVYFDGTKWLRRIELFAEQGFPIRVVHLVRDPRGFVASYLKNKRLEKTPENVRHAVEFWRRNLTKAAKLQDRFRWVPWHRIVYEDLCRDPDTTLRGIATFLDVRSTSRWPAFTRDDLHVTGNRVRFTFDGEIRKDEKWRTLLGGKEAEAVLAETRLEAEQNDFHFV